MKKNIFTVVGARPQFIKAAVISRLLKSHPNFVETLIHTGQHFDSGMSDIFFEELDMPAPAHKLNIHGGPHGQMTGRMMEAIEDLLIKSPPDALIVYGDTNSTLAGALAAAKLHIPVIHIEAGLRSYDQAMPEEINRVLTDHVSTILLCPTINALENLEIENISAGAFHTGDIMYDATLYALELIEKKPDKYTPPCEFPEKYALLTIHRAETANSATELQQMLAYANDFSAKEGLKAIFPVHPRTQKLLSKIDVAHYSNIFFSPPLSYLQMQKALQKAQYVLTDSGGLQKEAYFHRVPCITLRKHTEWQETIDAGWNRLWTEQEFRPRKDIHEYGDGNAGKRILDILQRELL